MLELHSPALSNRRAEAATAIFAPYAFRDLLAFLPPRYLAPEHFSATRSSASWTTTTGILLALSFRRCR